MTRTRRRRSFFSRMSKVFENLGDRRPFMTRTGPAWAFGIMGVMAELLLAPVILALTFGVGLLSYLILDTPSTRVRAQQRPRFVSVRILYLNTMIVAGFWLAVMFTFSAADPTVTNGVESRLPALLEVATANDLRALVNIKRATASTKQMTDPVGAATTWFDVFSHGLISALALNFLLYGVVLARRRQRGHHFGRRSPRKSIQYDASVGLFVDEDSRAPR